MRVCRHCGTILGDADRYCPYCGTRCEEPVETAVAGRGKLLKGAMSAVIAAAVVVIAYCCYKMVFDVERAVIVETVEPVDDVTDSIIGEIDSIKI